MYSSYLLVVLPRVSFRNTPLSSSICLPLAPISLFVVSTWLYLVIHIRIFTHLPIRHINASVFCIKYWHNDTSAYGMATTFVVCLSHTLLWGLSDYSGTGHLLPLAWDAYWIWILCHLPIMYSMWGFAARWGCTLISLNRFYLKWLWPCHTGWEGPWLGSAPTVAGRPPNILGPYCFWPMPRFLSGMPPWNGPTFCICCRSPPPSFFSFWLVLCLFSGVKLDMMPALAWAEGIERDHWTFSRQNYPEP